MKVNINGEVLEIEGDDTSLKLLDVLQSYGAKPPYAVAINGEFVAQSQYEQTNVETTDLLDVVSPIFGG